MCRLSDAELNCVSTNMRMTSELMQLEIGTSTSRYFPPSGTAGFDRCAVSGNKRAPAPPPRITASIFFLAIGTAWRIDGKGVRFQGWWNAAAARNPGPGLLAQELLIKRVLGIIPCQQ